MSLQIFLEVLKAGLSGLHMGIIPPTLDRLVVGDIRRTRLGELQYLFFVGMNEGTVPAVGKEKGIFSDRDRDRLEKAGVVLAPTSLQESFTENFYLYWLMARPSRYLFLSYSRLNSASETLRPSYLLNRIRRESRFQEEILLEDGELREAQMVDIREGFTYLSLHIQAFMTGQLMKEEEERFLLVFGWVKKNPRWEPVLKKILAGARLENRAEELPADVAAYLFGQGENMSVTRLERFAACEYAFFLQYGLKLQEREIFMLEASDLGELYHGAIDRFFYLASRYNLSVNQMEEETRKTLVKEAVDFVTRNFRHTILQSSAANQYRTERIRRTVDRTIWAIQKQLRMGDFQLAGHETAFGDLEKGTLLLQVNDNRTIRLLGKIDRVDVARSQNGDLVRIIDYKTGSQHFDYAKIEAGLQLQLLLYLYATLQERSVKLPGNHQIPAGLYYFHVQDPVMEVVSLPDVEHSEEANMLYEEELLKAMRMEGLTNASREVLLHGEKEFTSGKSRLLQQVELDKEGELKENGAVAGSRQMENLMDYALQKATDLGRGMFEGHMRVNPYVYGKKSPCDYCLYRTICGFDDEVKGYHKRQLYQRKAEDMWRKLRKEEEDGHQLDEGTTGSN